MKYVAKLVTGRLNSELIFEAESFGVAVERAENQRIQLDERLAHMGDIVATRIISVSETKKQ